MKGEKFMFPIADGSLKLDGEDQDLRTATLIWDSPDRGEEQDNLRGESEGSSLTPRQDSSWYDGEAKTDFWSISGNFSHRHHFVQRVKLYVPTEESFPIPLEYIDVTRTTHTLVDVLLEKHIEDFDGVRELSHTGTGFTRFIILNEWPCDGFTWSGERLTRKQTSRPDDVWPDMWTHMSDAAKKKVKQKWAIKKPKPDNARQLRGIFIIEPNDKEFKHTMKNARGKLEVPKLAAALGNTRPNMLVLSMPTNL